MTFISNPAKRLFVVYDGPSVADPLWLIKCAELQTDGSVNTNFSSYESLKSLISDCERDSYGSANGSSN